MPSSARIQTILNLGKPTAERAHHELRTFKQTTLIHPTTQHRVYYTMEHRYIYVGGHSHVTLCEIRDLFPSDINVSEFIWTALSITTLPKEISMKITESNLSCLSLWARRATGEGLSNLGRPTRLS